MESQQPQSARDAQAELARAEAARGRLAAGLRLPRGLHAVLAIAVAVQIATAAVGIAEQSLGGLGLVLAGLAVFLMAAAGLLHRFRRINSVRVDGFASQLVLGAGTFSSLAYVGAFGAATWAAFERAWWLVALAAVLGGLGYAVGARQWWRAYRGDPAQHAGGVSPRVLAGLGVLALVGFAALVVVG